MQERLQPAFGSTQKMQERLQPAFGSTQKMQERLQPAFGSTQKMQERLQPAFGSTQKMQDEIEVVLEQSQMPLGLHPVEPGSALDQHRGVQLQQLRFDTWQWQNPSAVAHMQQGPNVQKGSHHGPMHGMQLPSFEAPPASAATSTFPTLPALEQHEAPQLTQMQGAVAKRQRQQQQRQQQQQQQQQEQQQQQPREQWQRQQQHQQQQRQQQQQQSSLLCTENLEGQWTACAPAVLASTTDVTTGTTDITTGITDITDVTTGIADVITGITDVTTGITDVTTAVTDVTAGVTDGVGGTTAEADVIPLPEHSIPSWGNALHAPCAPFAGSGIRPPTKHEPACQGEAWMDPPNIDVATSAAPNGADVSACGGGATSGCETTAFQQQKASWKHMPGEELRDYRLQHMTHSQQHLHRNQPQQQHLQQAVSVEAAGYMVDGGGGGGNRRNSSSWRCTHSSTVDSHYQQWWQHEQFGLLCGGIITA
ncbi:unnamed protein product [Closterium sp. Naga37s-1]|nr:unnamed protein product [Closterium sp. Naga37s-1]